jgi:hypothetical protein
MSLLQGTTLHEKPIYVSAHFSKKTPSVSPFRGIWDCLPQGILCADDSTFYDDISTKKVDLAKNK